MKASLIAAAGLATALAFPWPAGSQETSKIIAFDTMYGVDGPFLHQPVRRVKGDDLPWVIESAQGSVDTSGHVVVHVRGLVFADEPEVPINLRGKNDAAEFRAVVSCITEFADVTTKLARATTDGFPATEDGDADIDDQVELPNPCVAPVVFIFPGDERVWFAVTGFEAEDEDEDAG